MQFGSLPFKIRRHPAKRPPAAAVARLRLATNATHSIAILALAAVILSGLLASNSFAQAPTPDTDEGPVAIAPAQPANEKPASASPVATKRANPAASKRRVIPTNPVEVAQALGFFYVIPFFIASVIAVWFAIERLVILRRGRVIPRPFVERFLEHLEEGKVNRQTALKLCEENGSAVAEIFAHGIRKWGKPSVEVEQAIIDGGERQVSQLRKHLRVLNGVATISPLIGLLGTVTGMITAFNEIANSNAMGKPEELAVGIAVALLTTAVGLMIAIPTLVIYMFLAGRVDALVMEMDELAQTVVHLISAEALSGKPVASGQSHGRQSAAGEAREKKAV